jgi:hypothetical protein
MTEALTGGCLCGVVRYAIEPPFDERPGWCHCSMCRRASGSPAVAWMTVPRVQFRVTAGEPVEYRSSEHAIRVFCGRCGSPITFRSEEDPGDLDVTLGTLDDPERVVPKRHIWTESSPSWLRLDEHLPRFPQRSVSPSPE